MLRAGRREVEWNFRSGGVAGGEGKEGAGNSELDTEWVGFLKKRNFFASLEKNVEKTFLSLQKNMFNINPCVSLIFWGNYQK